LRQVVTDRSIAAVFQDVLRDLQELVRAEVRLARAELRQEVRTFGSSIRLLALGGLAALFALHFLLFAAVYALATFLQLWVAALIVAGAVALVAGVFGWLGMKRLRSVHSVPPRTASTIKESVEWIQQSSS
jgi:hypothetical protein